MLLDFFVIFCLSGAVFAQQPAPAAEHGGGEANLVLPDLGQATFQGINGRTLLMGGIIVAICGLLFGLVTYMQLAETSGACLHAAKSPN